MIDFWNLEWPYFLGLRCITSTCPHNKERLFHSESDPVKEAISRKHSIVCLVWILGLLGVGNVTLCIIWYSKKAILTAASQTAWEKVEGVEIMLFFCDILSLTTCVLTVEWPLPGESIWVYVQEAAESRNTLMISFECALEQWPEKLQLSKYIQIILFTWTIIYLVIILLLLLRVEVSLSARLIHCYFLCAHSEIMK